ncbi:MAG: Acetylglutamate/acetylaminoadipate kinase [Candidatus Methanofastidiosum methylothiophilum]|jgi:acetylglutamate kinase|uniref:Acetylglutamate kinase n=1 Tax=Candidatus Methanofastidiosum methylothiophilum TaxID=1705564 RepID=A0A150JIY2_9EURY|nr:MAG: Acetylglutamate/acetylaminoadipate kinase [Candidatus Methanofastidiosum methylthiophilus]KYC56149.1 MAG: Acetylglutamate/acetylaminoadipate kinase [Candidatus Methanofastidiosum methylthiophilus]KYC57197.1 MAG: Acetylglutamate/acetylaminoadipate kinase [Candidatus Methanofastidiosum methylthiophilus]OQC51003.1 MAG: Acetylglutamate/acetylaminoadipate kinase [Euryarchaeota archaeon ADurb.Bin023]
MFDDLYNNLSDIKELKNKLVVIKYGGHAMKNEELKKAFAKDISLIKSLGATPVIVHGGGPEITSMLDKLGIKSEFYKGLRITEKDTMKVVEMILHGVVNRELVTLINNEGEYAVGISGRDGSLVKASKKIIDDVDLGFVGDINCVNTWLLWTLIDEGYIPIVSPIGEGENGAYNVNADEFAYSIAAAMGAEKLLLITDVDGIYLDPNDPSTRIPLLNEINANEMLQTGKISGGMIPKVLSSILALKEGVGEVHVINGKSKHVILQALINPQSCGTRIVL